MNIEKSRFNKLSITRIISYICIFLIVLQCRSWLMHINGLRIINMITKIAIAMLLLIITMLNKKVALKHRELLFLLIYNLAMIILCAIHTNFENVGFISNDILIFSLSYLVLSSTNYKVVLKQFSDIVIAICSISLFFFIFATCLHIIKPTMQFISNWGGIRWVNNYYFVYSEMQSLTSVFYTGYRNTAIWVEGPMLAFSVCMALNYEVFLSEKINKYRVIILFATIVTAFTTTGIIISFVIFAIRLFADTKIKRYFLWSIFPIVIVLLIISINYLLQDKMKNSYSSYSIHFDDISATLQCFSDNPIFGVGYNNVRGLDVYRKVKRANAGVSTGLGCVLAYGGMLWGIWYLVPFIISISWFIKDKNLRDKSGFVIVFEMLLVLTLVQETALCVMLNAINWKIVFNMREQDEN